MLSSRKYKIENRYLIILPEISSFSEKSGFSDSRVVIPVA